MFMHYYVLYVQSQYGDILTDLLNREAKIKAIHPRFEYYRRDKDGIDIKPLFPGYVLVKTVLDQNDFDDVLKDMEVKKGFLKELKYEQGISALSQEEIAVLKRLLDEKGLLKMSYGHLVNRRLRVDQGPLVGFDDYVTKVDKHNHLLCLNLTFLDQKWVAPITIEDVYK